MHFFSRMARGSVGRWTECARVLRLTVAAVSIAGTGLADDDSYIAVLEILSNAGPEAAVETLVAGLPDPSLETSLVAWEQRRHGQLGVAEKLMQQGVGILLPILDLHDQAQLTLRRQGRSLAADQERIMVLQLGDRFAQRASTETMRVVAADIFAVLAGGFHQRSPGPTAAGLYRRALQYNSRNPAALGGMAHLFESRGQYRKSLAYLELLFAVRPERQETRLRRAINLIRSGRRSEGASGLAQLVENAAEAWIVVIALEELIRSAIDAGDFEEARALISQHRTRVQNEPTLIVMAAYLDERLGSESIGASLSKQLEAASRASPTASRYRYAQWSADLYLEARARNRSAANEYRRMLGLALALPAQSLATGTP
jgi:Tfp pilus assembly protein PilF